MMITKRTLKMVIMITITQQRKIMANMEDNRKRTYQRLMTSKEPDLIRIEKT